MHGARCTNYVLGRGRSADLRRRTVRRPRIGKTAEFCPNAKIIHIDIDRPNCTRSRTPMWPSPATWAGAHRAAAARQAAAAQALAVPRGKPQGRFPLAMPGIDNPRTPYGLIHAVASCLDDSAIITSDVGQHQMWVAQAYPFRRARQWLNSGGLGTMGLASWPPSAPRWPRRIAPWCASPATAA